MNIETIFNILTNEYNSGVFTLEENAISWMYSSKGVDNLAEAEDRWLSFLGAKLTVQTVIANQDYQIVERFEINNRIGFHIVPLVVKEIKNSQSFLNKILNG